MRCMVFASQVKVGMWRRNGIGAQHLSRLYQQPPIGRILEKVDLVAIQLSTLTLSPDSILLFMIDSMELVPFLNDFVAWYRQSTRDIYEPALLGELLRLLILVVTHTPLSLVECEDHAEKHSHSRYGSNYNEGIKRVMSRNIVHQVLSFELASGTTTTLNQLLEKTKELNFMSAMGSSHEVSDPLFNAAVDAVLSKDTLVASSYRLYDPEYYALSDEQLCTAAERMKRQAAADGDTFAN